MKLFDFEDFMFLLCILFAIILMIFLYPIFYFFISFLFKG